MTDLKTILSEMKARCDEATPGPWFRGDLSLEVFSSDKPICIAEANHTRIGRNIFVPFEPRNNALFIAHARTDLPRLIQALEKLRDDWQMTLSELSEATDAPTHMFHAWLAEKDEEIRRILEGASPTIPTGESE